MNPAPPPKLISRRTILTGFAVSSLRSTLADAVRKPSIAITIDDLDWAAIPEQFREAADRRLLNALRTHKIRAGLFVIGRNGDTPQGRAILQRWNGAGHTIGNHTWTHPSYAGKIEAAAFGDELLRCDALVRGYSGFRPYFRFPVLKEGATRERRDWMRGFLKQHGYRNGAVTIDTSDWFYSRRLVAHMGQDPHFNVRRFRDPYLGHIGDRATYYNGLARQVVGREIPHTILLHYNLLNSFFLDDVLKMFRARGWRLVDAEDAFQDDVFRSEPGTVPAGESLVWALAKQSGRYDSTLRYPGEDDVYEEPILKKLGL